MKTKLKKLAGILSMLFAILAFAPTTAKAQCPYIIKNGLNCPVEVRVDFYTNQPIKCLLCNSIPSIIIPPGGFIPVDPCAMNCPNPCNIVVTVLSIGGMPVTPPVSADFNTAAPGNVIRPVNPQCSPTRVAFIYYDPTAMTFYIMP